MSLVLSPVPGPLARLQTGRVGLDLDDTSRDWSLDPGLATTTLSATGLVTAAATAGRLIQPGDALAAAGTLSVALAPTPAATPLAIQGFATVNLLGTAGVDVVTVAGATAGWFGTGDGGDSITLTGAGSGLLQVDVGAGNDVVNLAGSGRNTARVQLGVGGDKLIISGMAQAEIEGGDGNDLIAVSLDGAYRVDGGDGQDGLILDAGSKSVTFGRGAQGEVVITRGTASATVLGVEVFRFGDGVVLDLAQVLQRAGSPPVTGTPPVVTPPVVTPPVVTPPVVTPPVVTPPTVVVPTPVVSDPGRGWPAPPVQGDPNGVATAGGPGQVGVFGSAPRAVVTGSDRNDVFYVASADTVLGGKGDDIYKVWDVAAIVERPDEGIDTVNYGGAGTWVLADNVENLVLGETANPKVRGDHLIYAGATTGAAGVGNQLANMITGGASDNILDGRGGNDILTGGAGKDKFVFGLGYQRDVIADFRPGEDKVWLVSGVRNFDELKPLMRDEAGGAVIRLNAADTLTLAGRKVADLSARDFSFAVDFSRYRQSFGDEFNGFSRWDGQSTPDGGTWRTRMAFGDGTVMSSEDRQAFVDTTYKGLGVNPFSVVDGALKISGTWRPDLASQLGGKDLVSGVITTGPSFAQTYGYFEARMKMSDWQGGFPAFWLLPTDGSWPPEIDIMEQLGRQADQILQMVNIVKLDTTQWHTYGLEWTAERLAWFVDGQLTFELANTGFHKPMYMILNYALGGSWAGQVTKPAAPGGEVGNLLIDYVRAYALTDGAAVAATKPEGAAQVTWSVGAVAPGGKVAAADSFSYLADTTGRLELLPQDLHFASIRPGAFYSVTTQTDRAADSFQAVAANLWVGLNGQITDPDGGQYSLKAMTYAEVRLGGTKASSVALDTVQSGYVMTSAGNDTVTASNFKSVPIGRSTTVTVLTNDGNDSIAGWAEAEGRLEAFGGAGNDSITGSGAADFIHGGAGNDLLAGGRGADVFAFTKGQGGSDIITDFAPRTDLLRLEGYARGEALLSATADGALVTLPDGSILLKGIAAAQVGDWIFQYA